MNKCRDLNLSRFSYLESFFPFGTLFFTFLPSIKVPPSDSLPWTLQILKHSTQIALPGVLSGIRERHLSVSILLALLQLWTTLTPDSSSPEHPQYSSFCFPCLTILSQPLLMLILFLFLPLNVESYYSLIYAHHLRNLYSHGVPHKTVKRNCQICDSVSIISS